jgi:hypothetical protein
MTGALADAIARDILADRGRAPVSPTCFGCGRSFGRGDGRFCSSRCRAAFDAGLPAYDPHQARAVAAMPLSSWRVVAGPPGEVVGSRFYGQAPAMAMRADGFEIECRNCRRPFISKGLRCCSAGCESAYREKQDIAKTMAEVGMELTAAKRACEHCGASLPRWLSGGRGAVPKTRRFCSKSCKEKAQRLSRSGNADVGRSDAKKCPSNGGLNA